MREHTTALCIQDTSELDFNGQAINGLGPLSYEAQRGMYVHPTYVVSLAREPLGVLDAWMWAREPRNADGERGGLLESTRWTEGYERIAERAANLPDTRLVYLADREADIVALMAKARDLGHPADWLIRSQHNRALPEGGKLWGEVMAGDALGEIRFTLPARQGAGAREVKQQVWSKRVELSDGARSWSAPRREAGGMALAEQPCGGAFRSGGRTDRLVSGTLGDRTVLSRAQEWLPGRGPATVHRGPSGTGAGVVHGGGLADCPADAPGAHLS